MAITAFKADLWYGASGLGKTTSIGRLAEKYFKETGKRTRLASADGGGWEVIEPLVNVGIVEPCAVRLKRNRVEALDKICQGYWPEDPSDPESPLQPPLLTGYEVVCRRCVVEGKLKVIVPVGPVQPKGVQCPTCKAVIGPRDQDLRIITRQFANPKNDLRNVALEAIEGLTSCGDSILEYLMANRASLSQDPSFTWNDGETNYSGGNQTYYGFVQNRLYEFVHKSHMIPFVDKVVWTALEGKGEEEGSRIPIFGPSIAGKKATGKASQWFGNTLHFELMTDTGSPDENKQLKITNKFVIYVRNHADSLTKIPFQAKVRAPYAFVNELPDYMEADVTKLYTKLEELKRKEEERLKSLMPTPAPQAKPAEASK